MHNRTEKLSIDVLENIVKAVRLTPLEPVNRTEEQIVDVPAPQSQDEIVEVIVPQIISPKIMRRTEMQIVDDPGRQSPQGIFEVVILVPPNKEEFVEGTLRFVRFIPQDSVQNRTMEQNVDCTEEQIVDIVRF